MVFYNCPRCGFCTELRANMSRHLARKFNCQPLLENISISECFQTVLNGKCKNDFEMTSKMAKNDFEMTQKSRNDFEMTSNDFEMTSKKFSCIYCKKLFTRKNNLNNHVKKICKKRHKIDENKIIENLKTENEILKNNKTTTIQNNSITNNNNNNNNTIIINAFGKENLAYINKEYIHGLISEGPYGSIRKLIKYIHFNPDHKENHNIKIPNKRDKYAMVYDGNMWQVRNKKNMITTIADHAYGVIAEHCDDITSKKYDRFRDDFESDESRYMKRLAEDTELIILNGQKEVGLT